VVLVLMKILKFKNLQVYLKNKAWFHAQIYDPQCWKFYSTNSCKLKQNFMKVSSFQQIETHLVHLQSSVYVLTFQIISMCLRCKVHFVDFSKYFNGRIWTYFEEFICYILVLVFNSSKLLISQFNPCANSIKRVSNESKSQELAPKPLKFNTSN
jgi:hypothetical protein